MLVAAERRVSPLPHSRAVDTCLVICGPTGAGKTRLVLQMSDALDLLAVSADSRQVYRGFDIGTAKPTISDRQRVPHACLDLAEPTIRFTAYRWAEEADRAIAGWRGSARLPLLVGGAGFYIRALVHPATDSEPHGFARLAAHYLLVDPGASLREQIAMRAAAMAAGGWPEEVEQLINTVPADAPAWQASGYRAMRAYVTGQVSLATAVERVTILTRQYAKRQRTWFRHQLPAARVTRLDPTDPTAIVRALAWVRQRTAIPGSTG